MIFISKRFYWKKIRIVLLILAFSFTWFLLVMAITANRNGNMTIYIDKVSASKTLSLSESSLLTNPTGKLYAPALTNAWDEVVENIPENAHDLDGNNSMNEGTTYDHTKKNYVAYTFYLFNSGTESLDYTMSFNIEYVEKDIDSTIRIRLYEDDNLVTYAKDKDTEGNNHNLTDFYNDKTVTFREYSDFAVGQVRKYTIVMWIDADDKDTTNEKIGGSLVMSIKFSVKL